MRRPKGSGTVINLTDNALNPRVHRRGSGDCGQEGALQICGCNGRQGQGCDCHWGHVRLFTSGLWCLLHCHRQFRFSCKETCGRRKRCVRLLCWWGCRRLERRRRKTPIPFFDVFSDLLSNGSKVDWFVFGSFSCGGGECGSKGVGFRVRRCACRRRWFWQREAPSQFVHVCLDLSSNCSEIDGLALWWL